MVEMEVTLLVGSGEQYDIEYNPGTLYDYLAVGETTTDTLTITVDDGNGGIDSKIVDITIEGSADNTAPVANDDAITVTESGISNLDVLANDTMQKVIRFLYLF